MGPFHLFRVAECPSSGQGVHDLDRREAVSRGCWENATDRIPKAGLPQTFNVYKMQYLPSTQKQGMPVFNMMLFSTIISLVITESCGDSRIIYLNY